MVAVNKARTIAGLLNTNEKIQPDSDSVNTSYSKGTATLGTMDVYSSIDSLPTSATSGTKALVTSTNTLYIYSNGWYKIAIINNFNPQWITQPNSTYDLAINGTATTITVLASDSDDVPITYTAVTDSDFDLIATVTHDSDKHNTWTVVPFDSENGAATGGTGTVTFKASDGVNLVQALSTFSLTFGPDWSSTSTLTAITSSDGASSDYFGSGISFNSSDATYAIVGAEGDDDDGATSGSAYVFTISGSTWTEQAKLTASDAAAGHYFGKTVGLNSDATYAIVGARNGFNTSNVQVGAAYIFTRSGSTWTQQAKISPTTNLQSGDWFGAAGVLNSDATYAAISAYKYNHTSYETGRVYIYTRSGSSWSQQTFIDSPDIANSNHQQFGYSLDMNSDATYLAVGSKSSSKAHIYTRSGSTWTVQSQLVHSDTYDINDGYGVSISLAGDDYCIVGAWTEDGGAGDPISTLGAAYVFTRSGSTWTQQAKLTPSDTYANLWFGASVKFNSDATLAAVGARRTTVNSATSAGAVYIFERTGSSWSQIARLDRGANATVNANLGEVLEFSSDGHTIVSAEPYVGNGTVYSWKV